MRIYHSAWFSASNIENHQLCRIYSLNRSWDNSIIKEFIYWWPIGWNYNFGIVILTKLLKILPIMIEFHAPTK